MFSFPLTAVGAAGARSFRANYFGDANYFGVDGACEPLKVVPPGIVGSTKVSLGQNASRATTRAARRRASAATKATVFSNGRSGLAKPNFCCGGRALDPRRRALGHELHPLRRVHLTVATRGGHLGVAAELGTIQGP